MVSDLATPSVEQHCSIKSLMKEEVKSAKFVIGYLRSMAKKPCYMQVSMIGTVSL
jgi:hypothetical protein